MNKNQITLDQTKAYDISELNEEQLEQIAEATGDCDKIYLKFFKERVLYYNKEWIIAVISNEEIKQERQVINAKTLFN